MTPGVIVGIDPSLANTGWAVLVDGRLERHGTIKTTAKLYPKTDMARRLAYITAELEGALCYALPRTNGIIRVNIEAPLAIGGARAYGTMLQHTAYGAIMASVYRYYERHGRTAHITAINNMKWRGALGLNIKSTKGQIQDTIQKIVGKRLGEHESDAVGVALYG